MKETETFATIIKNLRRHNGWTQKYIADELGVKYQTYQKYEMGKAKPSFENLIKLADLFDVSMDYLIGRKDY